MNKTGLAPYPAGARRGYSYGKEGSAVYHWTWWSVLTQQWKKGTDLSDADLAGLSQVERDAIAVHKYDAFTADGKAVT